MGVFKRLAMFLGLFSDTRDLNFEEDGRTYFVSVVVNTELKTVHLVRFEVWEAGHEGILQLEATSYDFDRVRAHVKAYRETTFGGGK
jgi:hypothetical protein